MNPTLSLSELVLEVTNACPHRCIHCSTSGGIALPGELSRQEKLKVIREACALGIQDLRLLGGDPLHRLRDTVELLAEANLRGVARGHICTAACSPQHGWIQLLREMTPIQISVDVSVYSANKQIHDQVTTTPGSHDLALSNSRRAVEAGLQLSWNFVWMKLNFFELIPVVRLASELGIRRVRVLRLMLNGRAKENRALLEIPSEWIPQCDHLFRSAQVEALNVELTCSKPLNFQLTAARNRKLEACGACRNQIVVQSNGIAIPCIGMKDMPELELGSVRSDSLEEIWSRASVSPISQLSQKLDECTAALYGKDRDLVQISKLAEGSRK